MILLEPLVQYESRSWYDAQSFAKTVSLELAVLGGKAQFYFKQATDCFAFTEVLVCT